MPTPTSVSTTYASGLEATKWFDARVLGDCLGDFGARIEPVDVPGNANLAALLSAASGEIESALLRGDRYAVADLQALTGASLAFLKQIVVYLAVGRALWRRQPTNAKPACLEWAEGHLKELADGSAIFGLTEVADAGLQENVTRVQDDTEDRNRIVSEASRFFGRRADNGGF